MDMVVMGIFIGFLGLPLIFIGGEPQPPPPFPDENGEEEVYGEL